MSLERPARYGGRITLLGLTLVVLLGVGVNADALFGPVPEPEEGAEAIAPPPDGTDFEMETHVAEIMLGKATETMLSEATHNLPELDEGWSPESLPRSEVDEDYVEDEDEAEYYDDLDPLNTVMQASSDKERAALAKLFEKKEKAAKAPAPKPVEKAAQPAKPRPPATKPLAMRPNAAVITKKKVTPALAKGHAQPAKVSGAKKSVKAPTPPSKAKLEVATEAPPAEEAQSEKGPAINPNASSKELIAQGRKLLLSGQPGTAEKAYRLALQKKAGSARARYGLAKALYQRNRASEAIAELRKILSANKNHGSALLMMGSLLQEQGQAGQARTYYQRYLDARPNGRRADEVRSILGRL